MAKFLESVTQRSEYARECLDIALNISEVLNMPGFWIWQGSEYARNIQGSKYTIIWLNVWIGHGYAWIMLIEMDVLQHALMSPVCLNMAECPWICQKMPE